MKKLKFSVLILLIFSFIPLSTELNAQLEYIQTFNDSSCSTGECEVIVRQFTGVYIGYKVSVRCLEAGGDYGDWMVSEYQGVYPGSACNGAI